MIDHGKVKFLYRNLWRNWYWEQKWALKWQKIVFNGSGFFVCVGCKISKIMEYRHLTIAFNSVCIALRIRLHVIWAELQILPINRLITRYGSSELSTAMIKMKKKNHLFIWRGQKTHRQKKNLTTQSISILILFFLPIDL